METIAASVTVVVVAAVVGAIESDAAEAKVAVEAIVVITAIDAEITAEIAIQEIEGRLVNYNHFHHNVIKNIHKCAKKSLNVHFYSLIYRLHNLHPWYWKTHLYGLISRGEDSVYFLQLLPFTILYLLFHQVPITIE